MAVTDVKFEFYRGDTYERQIKISKISIPLTKMYFTIKERVEDKEPKLQKTLNNGITLIGSDDEYDTYTIRINANDTEYFKVNTNYVFDIEAHFEDVKRTLVVGTLYLKPSSTRACNEC